MEEFRYDINTKDSCWYKNICDKTKCSNTFCIRHYKMESLVHMATMEGKQKYPIQLSLDKDGADREAYCQLRDIQQNINSFVTSGKNLLIFSENTGNGKTEWCKKLMLSWFDSIWYKTELECRGLFISLPKLMNAMKENISRPNEYFQYVNENVITADLVVWDEINYKDYTQFERDYLTDIIDQRVSRGLSNIYTTNYSLVTVHEKLGSRLASRIIQLSTKVEFKGKDKRHLGV